jgi:hypothetical protein
VQQHACLDNNRESCKLRYADKLRSRFVRRRFSLAAAIQEDAALEGLSEAEILEQVRSKVRLQNPSSMTRRSGHQRF